MAGNEGSSAVTGARGVSGPMEWGRVRRLAGALLVAFSMIGSVGVVLAGTASAQTSSDPVLQWLPQIEAASAATGIGPEFIAAVIRVESVGDPNAVSSAGAIGLMQVMPAEFQSQGIPEGSWYDPATNILAGSTEIAKHLAATGSIEGALASYFGTGCDSTGTCTDGYISTVLEFAAAFAAAIASGAAVDFSGVTASTGFSANAVAGTVDSGAAGDSSWQSGAPPAGNDGWQGGPPADHGSGEAPPQGSPVGEPGNEETGQPGDIPSDQQVPDDSAANG